MEQAEFGACVKRLQDHMKNAVQEFFINEGIKPNWEIFQEFTSMDLEQAAREVLFFAGDIWPDETRVQSKAA